MTESAICDDHPRLIRTLQSPSIHWGRTGGLCSRNVLGVFCLPPSCPHSDFGTITGRVKAAVAYPPAVFAFANHSVDIVKITGSHISKVGANNGSAPLGSLQTWKQQGGEEALTAVFSLPFFGPNSHIKKNQGMCVENFQSTSNTVVRFSPNEQKDFVMYRWTLNDIEMANTYSNALIYSYPTVSSRSSQWHTSFSLPHIHAHNSPVRIGYGKQENDWP